MPDDVSQLLAQRRYDEALQRLLDGYEQKVFRMAAVMLRDRALAEEVTQDIFLNVWRVLPRYDGRAAVSTWLYTIARNACLSAVRRQRYRRVTSLDDIAEPSSVPAQSVDSDLLRCVARLPEVERQVVTLFYWEDRSVVDVAAALGMPEGTVKSHLHRARQALGRMLED
jgi:RNA polymerase sigma-70 factor (ECF subfamily)